MTIALCIAGLVAFALMAVGGAIDTLEANPPEGD